MSLVLILTEVKDEEGIQVSLVSGVLILRSFLDGDEFSIVGSVSFIF